MLFHSSSAVSVGVLVLHLLGLSSEFGEVLAIAKTSLYDLLGWLVN